MAGVHLAASAGVALTWVVFQTRKNTEAIKYVAQAAENQIDGVVDSINTMVTDVNDQFHQFALILADNRYGPEDEEEEDKS